MDQQRILLESHPLYVLACALAAAGIAYLLYRGHHPWNNTWNSVLLVTRFLLTFFLLFLLLNPIVKQIRNLFERPLFVILHDNSASIRETVDSVQLTRIRQGMEQTREQLEEQGFNVVVKSLEGEPSESLRYTASSTDLHKALRDIVTEYEGSAVEGVILPSDGIYNAGLSPLYGTYNFPVYTVGLGDTSVRTDLAIRHVAYNRIAYQGNKFPVRVEVIAKNLPRENITVTLSQRGREIGRVTSKAGAEQLLTFDFQVTAAEQGMQKYDIHVLDKEGETNVRNNRSSLFIDIVEGKKKILLVAPSPHPDIKPLRDVIERNANYEFHLLIPGVTEDVLRRLKPEQIDLVIFHQAPDVRGKTQAVFQQFVRSKSSLLLILGQNSDLRTLGQSNMPVQFSSPPRDFDQVTPVVNPSFPSFSLSPEATSLLTEYPPVSVHFGKIKLPLSATPLLFQRVGSLATEKPLLAVDQQNGRKIGIMLGEGLWRWRMNEYDRTEKTDAFNELFSKLVQFLSTTEDKRKFKSYPVRQDFSDAEPVVFESQVYNDLFEPVFGNKIDIEVTGEAGDKNSYSYVTSPGNIRYQIGGLKEGVYKYRSSTTVNNKREEVRGEFAVSVRQNELQNLTADFDLLRKLSGNTGGSFYKADEINELQKRVATLEAKSQIQSEEKFDSIINLKWVFFLLLTFVSVEWFARRYFGSY